MMRSIRQAKTLVGRSLGLLGAGALAFALLGRDPAAQPPPAQSIEQAALPGGGSFADVVEQVSPSVVNISVTKLTQPASASLPHRGAPLDEFLGRFFNSPQIPVPPRRSEGVGSGFVIDAQGHIVTNHHVVAGSERITVTLQDGRKLDAALVGQDPKTDLALLKVQTEEPLPYVRFGDSDRTRVGDWVLAIGNPFGLGGTATAGIVSARGRDIRSGPYDDYLQIDAPINSGNSGGPVFNTAGEVIGVNTAIFSPHGGNIGIGFAIPANQAKAVIEELKSKGSVERGWLGVQIQDIDEELAAGLGLESARGALIAQVLVDGPADRAGLKPGDVVTDFADKPIDSARALSRAVAEQRPDARVAVVVLRDGEERVLEVTLGDAEPSASNGERQRVGAGDAAKELGLTLQPLTEERRARYRISPNVQGALIVRVDPNGVAATKGLRPGDVIVQVNDRVVESLDDAIDAIETARSQRSHAVLLIRRSDTQRFVSLSLS